MVVIGFTFPTMTTFRCPPFRRLPVPPWLQISPLALVLCGIMQQTVNTWRRHEGNDQLGMGGSLHLFGRCHSDRRPLLPQRQRNVCNHHRVVHHHWGFWVHSRQKGRRKLSSDSSESRLALPHRKCHPAGAS